MDYTNLKNSAILVSILTLTNPIELIKIRLQTTQQLLIAGKITENYKNVRHCITSISKIEGLKSFWKGNIIGILRFFPNEMINFNTRCALQKYSQQKIANNVLIAIVAGWSASSVLYPFDILRMSLSNTTEKHYKIIHTLKTLIKTNGAKYFYKGFLNSLVGTAVFRGTFNGLYDTAKSKATSLETKAMIAYCCAVAAGGICYPLDSIRRRRIIMNSKQGLLQFGRNIMQKEGIHGFYKGLKLILPQSITGAVILMLFDTTRLPPCDKQL